MIERSDRQPSSPPAATQPGTPARRSQAAEYMRARILATAAEQFRQYGYDRTSLAEVGAAVGVTRGAVLYHFGSKAQVLSVLLEPFITGLDAALDELATQTPPAAPRTVIDAVLNLLLDTRTAVDLLARDIASRHALDLDAWFTASTGRLVRLLAPTADDPRAEARAYAAIGALIRPLAHLSGPIPDDVRNTIRQAALDALGRSKRRH